jgi:hypothetical protein
MENKELADKIIADFKATPEKLEGVKKELTLLFHKVVLDNASEIMKLDTEEQFYDFLAVLIDALIVLPQPFESFDGMAIKYVLKKFVDPILDKCAGANWYQKMEQLVAMAEIATLNTNNA